MVSKGVGCSGTLITNNLVLTAHHCVVETSTEGGNPRKGFAGQRARGRARRRLLPWGTVKVRAHASLLLAATQGGHGDIAVLVLSRKLVGLGMMHARLTDPPRWAKPSIRWDSDVARSRRTASTASTARGARREDRHGVDLRFRLDLSRRFGRTGSQPVDRRSDWRGVGRRHGRRQSDARPDDVHPTRRWRPLFVNAQLIVDGSSPSEVPPIGGCEPSATGASRFRSSSARMTGDA